MVFSASSIIIATLQVIVYWSKAPYHCLPIPNGNSVMDHQRIGTTVRLTARFHTRVVWEEKDRIGGNNMNVLD